MDFAEKILDSKWYIKRSFRSQKRIANFVGRFITIRIVAGEIFSKIWDKITADNDPEKILKKVKEL